MFLGRDEIKLFMDGGKVVLLEAKDFEEFLGAITEDGKPINRIIEVARDIWINPSHIASMEVDHKIW